MESDLSFYMNEAIQYEQEINQIKEQLNKIEQKEVHSSIKDPELLQLLNTNIKLKHRLAILNRAISNLDVNQPKMDETNSCQTILNNLFTMAISTAFPDLPDPPIIICLSGNNKQFGDYQCNSAMVVCKLLNQKEHKLNPKKIADKIIEYLPIHPLIDHLDVAKAGFINIYLSKKYLLKYLINILKNNIQPPSIDKKLKIIVDFSSPNIAKEMHVGHLRSTIIGESICRLLEYLGHDVLRLNHVGDWGTQFGMLIAYLQEQYPNYLIQPPPINDLQKLYKESKKKFDEDENFKKIAYDCVVKLQSFDPDIIKAWELICNVSRNEFQKIYDRLDVTLITRGESFYQGKMNDIVKELDSKGLLEEDEGRKIMWGNPDLIPMTIVKSDGGYTYDTSDMAALKQRLDEENADWIIYVTDSGQSTHFQILFECARKAGILKDQRVDHVPFGVVLGEDKKKFKTRSGDTVRLLDLLDEGLKRALDKLKEKNCDKELTSEELEKAQQSIAYGCIKYADLCHNRNHEYVFSFDKMLEDRGNTAVYLLYTYTRIKSIARNAKFNQDNINELVEKYEIPLEHKKEWKLVKVLFRFPDEVMKITKDLCLHHLCEYVYEISCTFTEFYDNCYCVEKNSIGEIIKINHGRILLTECTARIMEKCFFILGLKPILKM